MSYFINNTHFHSFSLKLTHFEAKKWIYTESYLENDYISSWLGQNFELLDLNRYLFIVHYYPDVKTIVFSKKYTLISFVSQVLGLVHVVLKTLLVEHHRPRQIFAGTDGGEKEILFVHQEKGFWWFNHPFRDRKVVVSLLSHACQRLCWAGLMIALALVTVEISMLMNREAVRNTAWLSKFIKGKQCVQS